MTYYGEGKSEKVATVQELILVLIPLVEKCSRKVAEN